MHRGRGRGAHRELLSRRRSACGVLTLCRQSTGVSHWATKPIEQIAHFADILEQTVYSRAALALPPAGATRARVSHVHVHVPVRGAADYPTRSSTR